LVYSNKTSNKSELSSCHVYPGITYFIVISAYSGSDSSNQYLLRVKNYPFEDNDFNAKIFTFNYETYNNEIGDYITYDSRPGATNSLPHLWNMNYDAGEYLNNSVTPAYSVFPNSSVFVVNGHGEPGKVLFTPPSGNITTLYAKNNSDMTSSDKAINAYNYKALDNVDLAIYTGCECGITDPTYGNVVSETIKQGVLVCISWKLPIYTDDGNTWLKYFFTNCYPMRSVESAANAADAYTVINGTAVYIDQNRIKQRYYGSSNLGSLAIG